MSIVILTHVGKLFLQLEREHYEYVPVEGKIVHKQTGELLDTNKGPEGTKWIFVMSTAKRLFAGQVDSITLMATSTVKLLMLKSLIAMGVDNSVKSFCLNFKPFY